MCPFGRFEADSFKFNKSEKEKINTTLEKFGDSILVLDKQHTVAKKHILELGKLPDKLMYIMKSLGLKIVIGTGTIGDVLEQTEGMKYRVLELVAKIFARKDLYVWGAGGYNSATKTIFMTDYYDTDHSSIILHEYGHAVGDLLRFQTENKKRYKMFHERFYYKLDFHIQQGKPGCDQGIRELVADSFADFMVLSNQRFIAKYDEEFYGSWVLYLHRFI